MPNQMDPSTTSLLVRLHRLIFVLHKLSIIKKKLKLGQHKWHACTRLIYFYDEGNRRYRTAVSNRTIHPEDMHWQRSCRPRGV